MANGQLYKQYAFIYQRASDLYAKPEIKASLEIILSVFTVTLLIFFAIRPTITNVTSLQKKIDDQQTVLTKADNKLAQLIKAETQVNDNQSRLQLYFNAVPESLGYFSISKRIEIIANESGVELDLIRLPGSILAGGPKVPGLKGDNAKGVVEANDKGVLTMNVEFMVLGRQDQVLSFVRSLTNMDMLTMIQNIKISKVDEQGLPTQLSLDGVALFYSITPVPTPTPTSTTNK